MLYLNINMSTCKKLTITHFFIWPPHHNKQIHAENLINLLYIIVKLYALKFKYFDIKKKLGAYRLFIIYQYMKLINFYELRHVIATNIERKYNKFFIYLLKIYNGYENPK